MSCEAAGRNMASSLEQALAQHLQPDKLCAEGFSSSEEGMRGINTSRALELHCETTWQTSAAALPAPC